MSKNRKKRWYGYVIKIAKRKQWKRKSWLFKCYFVLDAG